MHFSIVFSASTALAKWLELDAPRLPSPDGKQVGTQPIVTNERQISWQCHVIENRSRTGLYTVIAVEAYSRYVLLMPFPGRPRIEDLENEILRRWANEMLNLMIVSGEVDEVDVDLVIEKFLDLDKPMKWVRNTDLSVQGHASDAGRWVEETLNKEGKKFLDDESAIGLGLHINQFRKKAKGPNGKKETFYPMERMLEDALYRFGDGLANARYSQTRRGDFPNPYLGLNKPPIDANLPLPDNVVSIESYRKG